MLKTTVLSVRKLALAKTLDTSCDVLNIAALTKPIGGLWHVCRRKWATEGKALPITDVAAACGWRDTSTLFECYQQPDNETLLAVMSEERKVRQITVGERNAD